MQSNSKRNLLLWTVTLAAMALLLSACSMDSSPVSATSGATSDPQEFQYPPFDPTDINAGPEAGFRFVRVQSNALGDLSSVDCDSLQASRWCQAWRSNWISIPLVTVYIPAGVNPRSTTIRIDAPSGCMAVADFYPHPYQFYGYVQLRWNLEALGLPDDFDVTTLVPFYVNDDGVYERMPFSLDADHETLTVYTNHFSRYILGEPISAN